jgi:hypothetical protein
MSSLSQDISGTTPTQLPYRGDIEPDRLQPYRTATDPNDAGGSLPYMPDKPTSGIDLLAMAATVDRLQDLVRQLQLDNADLREDLAQRSTIAAEDLDQKPVSEFGSHGTHAQGTRLKASDLPKFNGRDNEDVDQWIEKVTAIFDFSGASNAALLQQLPLILQGNALTWFTQLGREKRSTFLTWDHWQTAIRNAFYMPNHRANLRRQCLYRTLRRNESFADYFQDKQKLQHYVYPAGTLEAGLGVRG